MPIGRLFSSDSDVNLFVLRKPISTLIGAGIGVDDFFTLSL